ncbi:hypothetical protein LXL04_032198 [Taraxacum kok-saghyz]
MSIAINQEKIRTEADAGDGRETPEMPEVAGDGRRRFGDRGSICNLCAICVLGQEKGYHGNNTGLRYKIEDSV